MRCNGYAATHIGHLRLTDEAYPRCLRFRSGSVSHWLIAAIGVAYVGIAVDQYFKDSTGVAIMFFGYALAQWGVYLQAK